MSTLRQATPQNKRILLAAARRAGMNQAQLARRIGRSPQYFNRVITHKVSSAVVWGQAWEAVLTVDMSMPSEGSNDRAVGE